MTDDARRPLAAPRVPVGHRIALAATWLVAAFPIALYLVHREDPELAVRVAQGTATWTTRTLLAASLLGVAALLYPPVPAWLRLRWNELWLTSTSDRAPLLRALTELQHFASAQRHFEVGRLALLRRDFPLALQHLQQAIVLDPEIAAAHHNLGLALFRVGQQIAAAPAFEHAERLDPGHAFGEALLLLARCHFVAGQYGQAVELLLRHQRAHGGSHRSHYWLGQALQQVGDHDGARAAFATAAAAPAARLSAEENWFRALARVRMWRGNPR